MNIAYLLVTALATVAVFCSNVLNTLTFVFTDAKGGHLSIESLDSCPNFNIGAFKDKTIDVPRMNVTTIAKCMQSGEAMGHPVICQLGETANISQNAVTAAIMADQTTYELTCRDGGDVHYITPAYRKPGKLADIVTSNASYCIAGFIYGGVHQKMLREEIPQLTEEFSPAGKVDKEAWFTTSFVSNFPEDAISTGSHAALVDSLAYQLEGTKVWLLHHMDESSSRYFYVGSWRMFPNCLETFLSGLKKPYVAVTNPGDILYFPGSYQHMVFTKEGPNVMTNIRRRNAFPLLRAYQTLSVEHFTNVVLFSLYQRFFLQKYTGNPREDSGYAGIDAWVNRHKNSASADEVQNVQDFKKVMFDRVL